MKLHILTTEQVFEYIKSNNNGIVPRGCSYRSLNARASSSDLPKKIIVGKNVGNRINLWAVADLKDLLNLLV